MSRQPFPEERTSIGWKFVFWWALASAAASVLGFLLFAMLYGISGPLMERQRDSISHLLPPLIMGVIAGALFGIAFGFFQWLVLRKYTTRAFKWLLATVLGLVLSIPLAFLAIELSSSGSPKPYLWIAFYLVPGIMVGAFQQFTLWRYYSWTWLWILANLLIWPVFILLFSESPLILIIIPSSVMVTGAISGFTLLFILRRRKDKEASLSREEVRPNRAWERPLSDIIIRSVIVILITLAIGAGILLAREYLTVRPLPTPEGPSILVTPSTSVPQQINPPKPVSPPEPGITNPLLTPPELVSPENGVILDNGRMDFRDDVIWDFDWSNVEAATEYHLYVIGATAQTPVINLGGITASSYHYSRVSYIGEGNRFGLTWKVRAKANGEWTAWSETRTFDVEPLNTDPPNR